MARSRTLTRNVGLIFCLILLAGCRFGEPSMMVFSFGANTGQPVVLQQMHVNDVAIGVISERVVQGAAERGLPRTSGYILMDYIRGAPGQVTLDLVWVALPGGQAYRAKIDLPHDQLARTTRGHLEIGVIFGPDGLLIISADPPRRTAADTETRDAARICGTRVSEADRDYAADPGALPGLPEALATAILTPPHLGCQA